MLIYLLDNNTYNIATFQIFNIYTANGSVISQAAGTTSIGANGTVMGGATGQIGAQGSIYVAKQVGVKAGMTATGITLQGVFKYDPSIPYYIPPRQTIRNINIRTIAKYATFLDRRGFSRVSKWKDFILKCYSNELSNAPN